MKRIPRNLIQHLEWKPQDGAFPTPPTSPAPQPAQTLLSIDNLINHGRSFYNTDTDSDGKAIGVTQSLKQAMEHGTVASLPYLIAGKAQAATENYLWQSWFSASEEHVGIDKEGRFGTAGKPVVVVVHGFRLLTPDRIMQAYADGLTPQGAAKLTETEFGHLLEGKLPSDESIQLYTVDQAKDNLRDPFGNYAVIVDFELAKAQNGYATKDKFLKNPLVLARSGVNIALSTYFDKAKNTDGKVGNHHRLAEIDPQQPQGRVLFVYDNYNGLIGNNNLYINGRFVGVAPEARVARK